MKRSMTTITPESLINEQVELERSQVRQGLKRLDDQNMKLEDKSYASATVYGISSIELSKLYFGYTKDTMDWPLGTFISSLTTLNL